MLTLNKLFFIFSNFISMKILIIGGTKFLGRHLVKIAKERNHSVTIFNRGKQTNEVFSDIEQIIGDRNIDLDKLKNQNWDAVIDTCGYLPQTVKKSAEALQNSVKQYVFISSISAYADFSQPNFDENYPIAKLNAEQKLRVKTINHQAEITAAVLGAEYGALKALCESEVTKCFPKNLIVRSGLIVGKFDGTDRFSYWVMRIAKGNEILAPANPKQLVQFIDAVDLANWIIKSIENQTNGIFNVTGKTMEFGKLLDEIKFFTNSNAKFNFVSEDFLKRENVNEWSDLPLYIHESNEMWKGFLHANIDKALAKDLTFRPLQETVKDIITWRKTVKDELKAGLSEEKETELLSKWKTN
jgi:2'-hydroxyisoflavone reductase